MTAPNQSQGKYPESFLLHSRLMTVNPAALIILLCVPQPLFRRTLYQTVLLCSSKQTGLIFLLQEKKSSSHSLCVSSGLETSCPMVRGSL